MPSWRAPALEAVLDASLDEKGLTEAALKRLVKLGVRESEQLDFKLKPHLGESGAGTSPPSKDWSAEQEFAKDVCIFANHLGGLILIGIKEENEVAVGITPTITDPGAVEHRLRQALLNYSTPPPRFHAIPINADAGGYYLALIVPPSPLAPHAVRGAASNTRRPLHFPIRDGAGTRWLLEHEVGDRYRSRHAGGARLGALRHETVDAGLEALMRAEEDLWLYVTVVPESPADQRLDQPGIAAMAEWWRQYGFASPLDRILDRNGTPTPAPGRITITGYGAPNGQEDTDPRGTYLELYVDGRAFAASPINLRTGHEDPSVVGERTLADDTILLTDVAVSWASHQAGAWGTAEIAIGLAASGQATGSFDSPVTMYANESDDLRRIRGTRAIRGPIQALTTADLADAQDQLGRLRAARDALTVLLHHFGIAETRQLEPDGTIVPWAWGSGNARSVEKWARQRELPFQESNHSSWD